MSDRPIVGGALFAGVFLLYVLSFSSVPTADGYWYISNTDRSDYKGILNASSALTGYVFFALQRLLAAPGVSIQTLSLIQAVNAVVAAAGAVLFCGVIRLLGGGVLLGVFGAGFLATSYGYWYFANGEFQHLSLVVLLLIFFLLVRARVRGERYDWRFVAGLGLLNSVATLLRQENFLFGFAAVTLLAIGRPWRQGLKDGLVYAVAGSVGTVALILVMGHFLLGASTFDDFGRWYLWLFYYVKSPREYQEFEFAMPFDVPRVVKGQLTALVFGTQAVVDTVRNPALLGQPKVGALLALTACAYGLMTLLVSNLWTARQLIRGHTLTLAVAAACAVWFFLYKVLVHAWFWPTSTKYQVVTLPPLILLLVLGTIATHAASSVAAPRPALRVWAPAALLVVVFVSNMWASIVPWYRYGQMKDALEARRATDFRPDDLFISSESGIDVIFWRGGNYLELKSVFMRLPKREGFESIRAAMDRQLDRRGRVYMYNLVPTPFTLTGINQDRAMNRPTGRAPEPLSVKDFEEFFEGLRKAYVLRPLFSYWEEGKAPLYLFGETQETFWEVTSRPAR